jgi:para-aminobenzoate synthetase
MAPLLGNWDGDTTPSSHPANKNATSLKSILYVDAYDSFSYNVVAMLEETLNVQVTVMTIDSDWPDGNMNDFLTHYEAIVLGPGPGNPNLPKDVGIMRDIWNLRDTELLPVFGICLGFQSLCLHHGVPIERLPFPLHGQVRHISTTSKDIFDGLSDVEVTLYHSLYADLDAVSRSRGELSDDLEFLAWLPLEKGTGSVTRIPMAVCHRQKPFWGVQFHPESCKSERDACKTLLLNWWRKALTFNKLVGRGGYAILPETIITPHEETKGFPDIAFEMLKWSSSTSSTSAYRSLDRGNLTAESLSELFNKPGAPTVLFQSNGRYNIVSVPSPGSWRFEFSVELQKLAMYQLSAGRKSVEDSLTVSQMWDALRYLMEMKMVSSGSTQVPFWGGFLGYFSYELGLACLPHPKGSSSPTYHDDVSFKSSPGNAEDHPADVSLLWCERSIVIDNTTGNIIIQSTCESDNLPCGWLDETLQQLQESAGSVQNMEAVDTQFLDSILQDGQITFPEEATYKRQIQACQAELEAGESYELCLTSETSITLPTPTTDEGRATFPWKLYKKLRKYNPAAFSAFADLGHAKIVSSSPECFLNWDRESMLEMKPMKGTVRKTPDMTMEKAREILGTTKEMAENLMIADLIRHDLYGICGSGGVRVEKLLEVEDHGRVYQMITHVKGEVRAEQLGYAVRHMPQLKSSSMAVHGLTALQRCLPPGSMTGAPKERSCLHLRHIEARKRSIYSGVMGYLDLGGGGSFSVLIRTAFTRYPEEGVGSQNQQTWRIGAGGAVTTLSTAEGEWQEMLTKLRTVCNVFTASEPASKG